MSRGDAIWQAVEQACIEEAAANGELEQQMMLSNFVIVAARTGVDPDGDPVTQVHVIPDGGSNHIMLGLLQEAQIRFQASVLSGYMEEDRG